MGISSILNIGQSALAAAELGITTTGNNIANASTPGYSRESILQTEAMSQGTGSGFVGSGVAVATIQRQYSSFATQQVNSAQASSSNLSTYYTQMQQVDNMLGDTSSGLNPTMQSFFSGLQTLSTNPASLASRQAALSDAQTMTGQFQSMGQQLDQINQGVNTQISTSVGSINAIASQIAQLNVNIQSTLGGATQTNAGSGAGIQQQPNTLLDQRNELVSQLSQLVGATVVQNGGAYDVYIGNGQPLVTGANTNVLSTVNSNLNSNQLAVAFTANGLTSTLPDSALTGGQLGGLLSFRDQSLNSAQNQLGLLAIGMGSTVNAQQALGQDLNGHLGSPFFTVATPQVNAAATNTGSGQLSATISNVNALTAQNYQLSYNAGTYTMTPLGGGAASTFTTFPQVIGGVTYAMTGAPVNGDMFLIQPTVNGADGMSVALSDPAKIAAAAPIVTSAVSDPPVLTTNTVTNSGSGAISAASIGTNPVSPLTASVNLTFNSATNTLSGFPAGQPVTVTLNGNATTYPSGTPVPYTAGEQISFQGVRFNLTGAPNNGDSFVLSNGGTGKISAGSVSATYLTSPLTSSVTLTYTQAGNSLSGFTSYPVTVTNNGVTTTFSSGPVTYTPGASISSGGMNFVISGTPINNDTFTIAPNTNGVGDNRNAVLLAGLQSAKNLLNGTSNYQAVYANMVSSVANKTSELNITSTSESNTLTNLQNSQQAISGVNLNEEANNLLQYQQAYQAAGKLMQVASQLFTTLITSLGGN